MSETFWNREFFNPVVGNCWDEHQITWQVAEGLKALAAFFKLERMMKPMKPRFCVFCLGRFTHPLSHARQWNYEDAKSMARWFSLRFSRPALWPKVPLALAMPLWHHRFVAWRRCQWFLGHIWWSSAVFLTATVVTVLAYGPVPLGWWCRCLSSWHHVISYPLMVVTGWCSWFFT